MRARPLAHRCRRASGSVCGTRLSSCFSLWCVSPVVRACVRAQPKPVVSGTAAGDAPQIGIGSLTTVELRGRLGAVVYGESAILSGTLVSDAPAGTVPQHGRPMRIHTLYHAPCTVHLRAFDSCLCAAAGQRCYDRLRLRPGGRGRGHAAFDLFGQVCLDGLATRETVGVHEELIFRNSKGARSKTVTLLCPLPWLQRRLPFRYTCLAGGSRLYLRQLDLMFR